MSGEYGEPILSVAQTRACDRYAAETLGVPVRRLMEGAARAVVDVLTARYPEGGGALFLCGAGHNGGDGFAAARFLQERGRDGWSASVCYLGPLDGLGRPDEGRMSEACACQYGLTVQAGVGVLPPDRLAEGLAGRQVIVDAAFGTGLSRPVTGAAARALRAAADARLPVVAVDIPSGVEADTGRTLGEALPASVTVVMQRLQPGHLLFPGAGLCGEMVIADIGIPEAPGIVPFALLTDDRLLRRAVPPRLRRTHKGVYGRLCLACGSPGMGGAAFLAGKAALRAGAGLVRLLTFEANRTALQTALPEAVLSPISGAAEDLARLPDILSRSDGVVAGCGLGRGGTSARVLRALLEAIPPDPGFPVVLDADALVLLGEDEALFQTRALSEGRNPVVLTPHALEMRALTGEDVGAILDDLPGAARRLAARRRVTVVLKDAHTVVAGPDGRLFLNASGNAGMATGGSGDALAGVLGALLVRRRADLRAAPEGGVTPAEIAAAAVYLHGRAGDAAASEIGEEGLLPSDLIERLPLILKGISDTRTNIDRWSDAPSLGAAPAERALPRRPGGLERKGEEP